jgi:hypothetical protein
MKQAVIFKRDGTLFVYRSISSEVDGLPYVSSIHIMEIAGNKNGRIYLNPNGILN